MRKVNAFKKSEMPGRQQEAAADPHRKDAWGD
jgi:hypothetical protein